MDGGLEEEMQSTSTSKTYTTNNKRKEKKIRAFLEREKMELDLFAYTMNRIVCVCFASLTEFFSCHFDGMAVTTMATAAAAAAGKTHSQR